MTPLSLINELALDLEKLSKTLLLVVEKTKSAPAKENVLKQEVQSVEQSQSKQEVVKPENLSGEESLDKENEPVVTIEQVRAVLAEKSQAGLTVRVKELLESFGASKLSAIAPEEYEKILIAAKKLK